jgi:carboxyl-terminal processing protease
MKLAVLINDETASAAEVLAGTLQDHDRAKVVGVPSFGKGVVQASLTESWGGKTLVIEYPVAFYYLPSGRCIDKEVMGVPSGRKGITPDLIVPLSIREREALRNQQSGQSNVRRYVNETRDVFGDLMIDNQINAAIELLKE